MTACQGFLSDTRCLETSRYGSPNAIRLVVRVVSEPIRILLSFATVCVWAQGASSETTIVLGVLKLHRCRLQ